MCGEKFHVQHALICKKGGFVSQRHDHIRDLLTVAINKVCLNVQSEPHLIPLTGEHFRYKTANTNDESRLDIKANIIIILLLFLYFTSVVHHHKNINKIQ